MCNNSNSKRTVIGAIVMALLLLIATAATVIVGEAISMSASEGSLAGYWGEVIEDFGTTLVLVSPLCTILWLSGSKRRQGACSKAASEVA